MAVMDSSSGFGDGKTSMVVMESSSGFGDGKVFPPGFRFHPTDEELVVYYLKRKICRRSLKLDIIGETDVYKWDPEELPGLSKLKTGDRQWFFFSPRDRKYPNGARSNRATMHGFWKATGKDRSITCNSRSVGIKKTLVFHKGRAPSGQRTDWVMHEYTLGEEELKRCQSVYDYYALYKVYKKSGPGPKNGEQYGAPFKEEEWADDQSLDVNGLLELENPVQELNHVVPLDDTRVNGQQQPPLIDLEELLKQVSDEPVFVAPHANAFSPVVGEEEAQNALLNYSLSEVNFPVQNIVVHPSYNPSFNFTCSATSQLQPYEAPEVTSVPTIPMEEPQPQVAGEDFLEDFLEMDDLIGPEPAVQNFENPVENLHFDELDVFDLYHDTNMFFHEMGPGENGHILQPYMNNPENGMENLASHSNINNVECELLNYPVHSNSNNVSQINYELWTDDQRCRVFTPAEATYRATTPPATGVVFDHNSAQLTSETNHQSLKSKEDDGTVSWLSSTLWSFVDSIPSAPASASDSNALVNRAFGRMSSFSRGRINVRNTTDVAVDTSNSSSRRSGRSSSRIIYFSILGVLFAILWVFIGTSVEVLGNYISS